MTGYEAGDPTILWVVGIWLTLSLFLTALYISPKGRALLHCFEPAWDVAKVVGAVYLAYCLVTYWDSMSDGEAGHEAAVKEELCRLGSDLCNH